MERDDIILTIVLLVFCIISFFFIIPNQADTETLDGMASSFMPRLAIVIIALSATILLFRSVRHKREPEKELEQYKTKIDPQERKRIIISMIVLVLAVWLIGLLGYFITIPAVLIFFMLFLGQRKWKVILLVTVLFNLSIYCFFWKAMNIMLPVGSIFQ